jgi:hypothetical protein
VLAGHKTTVFDAVGSCYRNIELACAVEDVPLGTRGADPSRLDLAQASTQPVWVMNGDAISAIRRWEVCRAFGQVGANDDGGGTGYRRFAL